MDRRLRLQKLLVEILEMKHVYHQPPENVKMEYPAIVYSKQTEDDIFANNLKYKTQDEYQLTVIDRNPDSKFPGKISKLPFTSHNTRFVKDGLYHDVFTLYY